jgi:hypothetical protein
LSLGDNCPGVGRVVKVDVSVEIEDVEEYGEDQDL